VLYPRVIVAHNIGLAMWVGQSIVIHRLLSSHENVPLTETIRKGDANESINFAVGESCKAGVITVMPGAEPCGRRETAVALPLPLSWRVA
jgi:hypothetical protein